MEMEDIFAEASSAADIVSVDRYMALHWGWPYDVAEEGGTYICTPCSRARSISLAKNSYERYTYVNNGVKKPMVLSEFNSDGDVTGTVRSGITCSKNSVKCLKKTTRNGFQASQCISCRDRGRLGLGDRRSKQCKDVGIEQPLMDTYREIIHDDFFSPSMDDRT